GRGGGQGGEEGLGGAPKPGGAVRGGGEGRGGARRPAVRLPRERRVPPRPRAHPDASRAAGGPRAVREGSVAMEPVSVTVTVNGTRHERAVEPRRLLCDFIRHDLGLTGTHG